MDPLGRDPVFRTRDRSETRFVSIIRGNAVRFEIRPGGTPRLIKTSDRTCCAGARRSRARCLEAVPRFGHRAVSPACATDHCRGATLAGPRVTSRRFLRGRPSQGQKWKICHAPARPPDSMRGGAGIGVHPAQGRVPPQFRAHPRNRRRARALIPARAATLEHRSPSDTPPSNPAPHAASGTRRAAPSHRSHFRKQAPSARPNESPTARPRAHTLIYARPREPSAGHALPRLSSAPAQPFISPITHPPESRRTTLPGSSNNSPLRLSRSGDRSTAAGGHTRGATQTRSRRCPHPIPDTAVCDSRLAKHPGLYKAQIPQHFPILPDATKSQAE